MKKTFKIVFLLFCLSMSAIVYSQSEVPLGALPMEYNGSFAGENGNPRLSSSFTYMSIYGLYTGIGQDVRLYSSYDQFITSIGSGVGVTLGYRFQNIDTFITENPNRDYKKIEDQIITFSFAPKISIQGKYTLSPSIEISNISRDYKNDYPKANGHYDLIRSRAGLLWNSSKYYLGISAFLYDEEMRLMTKNSLQMFFQAGYTFQRSPEANFSFTPQVVFGINQRHPFKKNIFLESYILSFRHRKFLWGINNASLFLGLQTERLRVVIGNGSPIESFALYTGNLSFRYIFSSK